VRGSGWGAAVPISTAGGEHPQIAIDGQGNALAVWEPSGGAHGQIGFSHYIAGTGWGSPEGRTNIRSNRFE
jgi:hypothetical protein